MGAICPRYTAGVAKNCAASPTATISWSNTASRRVWFPATVTTHTTPAAKYCAIPPIPTKNGMNLRSSWRKERMFFTWHDLRHTWASWLVQRWVPLLVFKRWVDGKHYPWCSAIMPTYRQIICSYMLRYCLILLGIREMMAQIWHSSFSRSVWVLKLFDTNW